MDILISQIQSNGQFYISFRHFKNNEHTPEIKAYITKCTIGDWFVLYQMSKNLNRRFFNVFLTKLSKDANTLFA